MHNPRLNSINLPLSLMITSAEWELCFYITAEFPNQFGLRFKIIIVEKATSLYKDGYLYNRRFCFYITHIIVLKHISERYWRWFILYIKVWLIGLLCDCFKYYYYVIFGLLFNMLVCLQGPNGNQLYLLIWLTLCK